MLKYNVYEMKMTLAKLKKSIEEGVLTYLDPYVLINLLDYHLNPVAIRSKGDFPSAYPYEYKPSVVRQQLENSGISVESYRVDVKAFYKWLDEANFPESYSKIYGSLFLEKALEHYLSTKLLELEPKDVLIDVAAADSPWSEIAERLYGCNAYALDISFSKGINGKRIGTDAASMPLPDNSATKMALHCSFEMFEGDTDSLFIKEAGRVLKPGGKMVIIPLYVHEIYHILRDPKSDTRGLKVTDKNAKIIYLKNFGCIRFARFYSVEALQRRVLSQLSDMKMRILFVENEKEIDPACYVKFIAIFEVIK